jgi:beta-lactamase regulating signal transducer with metallopeptidase domain
VTGASWSETLLQFAASNIVLAVPVALVALWAQGRGRRPFLAHLLWLVVLVKLVTPPILSLQVAPLSAAATHTLAPPVPSPDSAAEAIETSGLAALLGRPLPVRALLDWAGLYWKEAAAGVWMLGSLLVLAGSCLRIVRFETLLRATSRRAEPALQNAAAELARDLGLGKAPRLMITEAAISPLVWWSGGAVRLHVPRGVVRALDGPALHAILAHELGHVRRGDHYVRWLELAVCVALWWNPLAWWARRNLRACEEICCDALVLSSIGGSRKAYAGALVSAMELLAPPTLCPASLASSVDGGGSTERRIRMILSTRPLLDMPRRLRGALLLAAAAAAPLGFTLAQDEPDLARVAEWLDAGVNSAYLTREQADIMLHAVQTAPQWIEHQGNVIMLRNPAFTAGAVTADEVTVLRRGIAVEELTPPADGSTTVFVLAHDGQALTMPVPAPAPVPIRVHVAPADATALEGAEALPTFGVQPAEPAAAGPGVPVIAPRIVTRAVPRPVEVGPPPVEVAPRPVEVAPPAAPDTSP